MGRLRLEAGGGRTAREVVAELDGLLTQGKMGAGKQEWLAQSYAAMLEEGHNIHGRVHNIHGRGHNIHGRGVTYMGGA